MSSLLLEAWRLLVCSFAAQRQVDQDSRIPSVQVHTHLTPDPTTTSFVSCKFMQLDQGSSLVSSPVLPLSSIGNLRESKTRNPIRSLSHDNYLTPDLWKCADSKVKTNVQHRPKIKAQVPLTPKYAIKGKAIAPVRIIILNSIGAAQNI